MKKNSLGVTGLSLSQAQAISNLCNQAAQEIERVLTAINNCAKTISIDGKDHILESGNRMPTDIVTKIKRKAALHACQAFLVENIQAKKDMLTNLTFSEFYGEKAPIAPKMVEGVYEPELDIDSCAYGWEKLSLGEINEYLEVSAVAAHIGKFIHKGMPLDLLRLGLSNMKTIDWISVRGDGTKTPVRIEYHHEPKELFELHTELANAHRIAESRVNYFLSKARNITTDRNIEIVQGNAIEKARVQAINVNLREQYANEMALHAENSRIASDKFEEQRHKSIKEVVAYRIAVAPRFQAVVDEFFSATQE